MPAVSYLFGVRGALLTTFGVITPAIAANDLNPWVLNHPLRKGFGLPIWQKVYWHSLFEIDEDGAEGNPSPKRKIIHTQHARRRVRGLLSEAAWMSRRSVSGLVQRPIPVTRRF